MKKCKKIISLVLSAVLILSVCFTGSLLSASAAATVIDEGNLLLNGSFEQASTVWNNNISKGGRDGFTGGKIVNGQDNAVLDYWRGYGHYYEDNKVTLEDRVIYIDHTDDAYSGSLALKFYNSGYAGDYQSETVIYPNGYTKAVEDFATGNYRLTFMVKGTNTASIVTVVDASGKEHAVELDAAEGYNDATYSTVVVDNLSGIATTTQNGKTVLNIKIRIKSEKNQATEIYIDDARLEEVPVVVDPNLIIDGGFETPAPEDTPTDIVLGTGKNNQTNSLSDTNAYWAHSSWAKSDVTITRTIDSHNGNYALRFDLLSQQNNTANEFFYVRPNNVSSDKFETGTYTFSCWVKGDRINKGAYIAFGDSKTYIPSAAANGWVKISVENIKLSSIDDLGYAGSTSGGDNVTRYSNLQFVFSHTKSDASGTYLIVDDFRLEKVDESGEKLLNTSFENISEDIRDWNDKTVSSGQFFEIVNYWYDHSWNSAKKITHTTDNPHSGAYALKFAYNTDSSSVFPELFSVSGVNTVESGDTTTYTLSAGKYQISVWARGTTKIQLKLPDSKNSAWIEPTSDWQQYTYTAEYTNDVTLRTATSKNGSGPLITTSLGIGIDKGTEGTFVVIDDISFTSIDTDTIDDVKGQIMGIKQPAVGANKLELPALDTNNDAITVSIAASSNEGVIALDGTITTPKTKKVVDITLKVTDGTNEVVLKPIGVLVQGELDGVTEGEMADAINGLDVKAETAAADIAQIEYWLSYRGDMVTKDNKNLFAQKKLVYTYDIESDYVLDSKDIKAVRDELLGDGSQHDIRYLVTMYTKVVEYNGYN